MTTIRVDAAEVAELGVALAETGADLLLMGDPAAERWALGPGAAGPAVEELLGGWRRVRLALGGSLDRAGRRRGRGRVALPRHRGRGVALAVRGVVVSGLPPLPGHPGGGAAARRPARRDRPAAVGPGRRPRPAARRRHLGRPGRRGRSAHGCARSGRCWMPSPCASAGRRPPLRALADAMEEAQAVVARAVLDVDEAEHTYAVLEDRAVALVAAGAGEGDPEVLVVRHLQLEQVEVQQRRRGRGTRRPPSGSGRPTAAARPSSARLSVDGLADSLPYRVLAGVSSAGHDAGDRWAPVAAVVPELRPVAAAADAVAVAADAALAASRTARGMPGQLAVGAGLAAAGALGGALRRGRDRGGAAHGGRRRRHGTPHHPGSAWPWARCTRPGPAATPCAASFRGAAGAGHRRARSSAGRRSDRAGRAGRLPAGRRSGPGPARRDGAGSASRGAEPRPRRLAARDANGSGAHVHAGVEQAVASERLGPACATGRHGPAAIGPTAPDVHGPAPRHHRPRRVSAPPMPVTGGVAPTDVRAVRDRGVRGVGRGAGDGDPAR